MKLGVRDAAELLEVSEKTIYRWIRESKVPAYKINEQYRFNRAQLLEWATANRIHVSPRLFAEPEDPARGPLPTVADAVRAGQVFYRVGGHDKASVLGAVVELMPLPEEVDRPYLLQVLLARESIGSTGVGGGVAIPHVRNPIVMHLSRPLLTVCFLERPIAFESFDGQPVHTLFTTISPTVRAHLHLLSRLAYALKQSAFMDVLTRRGTREDLLAACEAVEQQLEQQVKHAAQPAAALPTMGEAPRR